MTTVRIRVRNAASGRQYEAEAKGGTVYHAWTKAATAAWRKAGRPAKFGPGWDVESFKVDGQEWKR